MKKTISSPLQPQNSPMRATLKPSYSKQQPLPVTSSSNNLFPSYSNNNNSSGSIGMNTPQKSNYMSNTLSPHTRKNSVSTNQRYPDSSMTSFLTSITTANNNQGGARNNNSIYLANIKSGRSSSSEGSSREKERNQGKKDRQNGLPSLSKQQSSSSQEQGQKKIPMSTPSSRKQTDPNTSSIADMQYIKNHVEPILSLMMVKIINEEPKDVIQFILNYLKRIKKEKEEEIKQRERPK